MNVGTWLCLCSSFDLDRTLEVYWNHETVFEAGHSGGWILSDTVTTAFSLEKAFACWLGFPKAIVGIF